MFTSGSTGRPKGVTVGPRPSSIACCGCRTTYRSPQTTWWRRKRRAVLMSRCWNSGGRFITGASLVMAEPEAHPRPPAMQRFFAEYGVTTTHFVPSMLAAFVASLTPETAAVLSFTQTGVL
ncbi:AMP-binding protein [Escherichia coli]